MTHKREKEHESLYNKWNLVRNKNGKKSKEDSIEIEKEIASKYSSLYFEKIKKKHER